MSPAGFLNPDIRKDGVYSIVAIQTSGPLLRIAEGYSPSGWFVSILRFLVITAVADVDLGSQPDKLGKLSRAVEARDEFQMYNKWRDVMRQLWAFAATAVIIIGAATNGHSAIVVKTNTVDVFVDGTSATRTFSIDMGDLGGDSATITDVDISIFFAKSNNNAFVTEGAAIAAGTPFLNEIEFVLSSPGGTDFTLISNDGGTEIVAGDNIESFNAGSVGFKGTIVFDQAAGLAVNNNPNALTAGTFRPDDATIGSLNSFNGESAIGTWTLFLEDDVGLDGLSFYEATITVTTAAAAVPEPSSLMLVGLVGGMSLVRRRRK